MRWFSGFATFIMIASLAAAGCQRNTSAVDSQRLAQARGQFVLADEPAGVEGVLDVQESYDAPRKVVLVGQIGGVDNPWTSGQASFVMADPVMLAEADDGEHICDDSGCKFCVRKAVDKLKEGLALVRFIDEDGQVVPIDARQLFDLEENQTVVVRGRAEIDVLGCLVVLADGLYVRQ